MAGPSPLDGIRVLDLSRLLPAPFCSMILADLGAQVDKVEDPSGDYARVTPPFASDGMGVLFHWVNRGKRSIALDLKTSEGRDAFLRLVPHYDVLLESNRPGVLGRLGLGYETLRDIHPGLIYCALSGYGQDGPLEQRAGHDLNYVARAGILGFTGPVEGPPQMPGVQMADISGALYSAIGILAALRGRELSGEGRLVDISLAESALTLATFGFSTRIGGWAAPAGADLLMGGLAIYNTYHTKDGGSVTLGALEPKFWRAFCEGVGIEPEMNALMPGPHQDTLRSKLRELFAERTREEWDAFSRKHDCCVEIVLTPEEVIQDPHFRARGVWVEGSTQDGTPLRQAKTPVAPAGAGPAPRLGQHTEDILREADFSESEALRAKRASGDKG